MYRRLTESLPDHEKGPLLIDATSNADGIISLAPSIHAGFAAILQSIVIQAWTAFEGLAEDLHTDARKEHPECFKAEVLSGKKYHFRKLDELPKSYGRAFEDAAIVGEVENSDVRALGLLRHLLVHKNGKVDQTHLDQRAAQPVVNQLDSFGLDSTVVVTGTLVRSLVDPVTEHGFTLLKAVDSWLTSHKPK